MPNTRLYRAAIWAAGVSLAALLLALVYTLGYVSNGGERTRAVADQPGSSSGEVDFSTLDQILGILEEEYFGRANLDAVSLYEAAVRGMLASLSDTGTFYVDATTNQIAIGLH